MAKVSDARIALAAVRAGFPVDEIPTAVAICLAESDGDPLAKGTNGKTSTAPGSHDLGLAQINDYFHSDLLAKYDWRNPDQNLKMAYLIWRECLVERGGQGASGWEPWATYNHDSYAKYLKRGEAAYRSLYRFTLTRYLMNHHGTPRARPSSTMARTSSPSSAPSAWRTRIRTDTSAGTRRPR
jgi:hypothetical protein